MKALRSRLFAIGLAALSSGAMAEVTNTSRKDGLDRAGIERLLDERGNANAFVFIPDSANPQRQRAASLLELAARNGDAQLCTKLLARGAAVNLNLEGGSPIHGAVASGSIEIAKLLLAAGAHPDSANAEGNGALLVATQNGDLPMVRLLLEAGANPDNARIVFRGAGLRKAVTITPLLAALEGHRLDIAQALLDGGADINFAVFNPGSNWLYTSLGYAIYRGHTDQVRFLVERGASIDASMMNGNSVGNGPDVQIPLAQALSTGDGTLAKLLIEYGANPFARTRSGLTIAHIVAMTTAPDQVTESALRWLAEQGVPLETKAKNGMTPLALAVGANRLAAVRTLLELGVDAESALPYATQSTDMTRILLGARPR